MKATGIVRQVDDLGRVVIPKELRKTFNIAERDTLEIFTEGEQIVLKKYQPACIFCGEASDTVDYKGKKICKKCLKELKEVAPEVLVQEQQDENIMMQGKVHQPCKIWLKPAESEN